MVDADVPHRWWMAQAAGLAADGLRRITVGSRAERRPAPRASTARRVARRTGPFMPKKTRRPARIYPPRRAPAPPAGRWPEPPPPTITLSRPRPAAMPSGHAARRYARRGITPRRRPPAVGGLRRPRGSKELPPSGEA